MTTHALLQRFHRVRVMVFGILALSYMLVFFHRIAPGVISAELMREFSTSAAALGSLAAMYFYVYAAMQIPGGMLADTLGVRLSATIGALVAGLGSILFGVATDFTTATIGRFIVGLGVSVVFVGLMRANTVWWSESRYGFISGLTVFLGNVGAILAAGPLAAVLAVTTWRAVFVTIGVLSIALAALTYFVVRNRPEDAGFPSLREMEGSAPSAPSDKHWLHGLRDVLWNRSIWPGFWTMFGMNGSFFTFIGLWSVPMLRDVHGLSRADASIYPTATLAAYAVGALTLGTFSDYIRRRKPVIIGAVAVEVLVWLAFIEMPWTPGWSGLLLFMLLGLTASGFVVIFGTAKEVVAPAVAGTAIAVVNTGAFLSAAISQPLFGWLMDLGWQGAIIDGVRHYDGGDYRHGLWLCFFLTLFAVVCSLWLRETRCRNIAG